MCEIWGWHVFFWQYIRFFPHYYRWCCCGWLTSILFWKLGLIMTEEWTTSPTVSLSYVLTRSCQLLFSTTHRVRVAMVLQLIENRGKCILLIDVCLTHRVLDPWWGVADFNPEKGSLRGFTTPCASRRLKIRQVFAATGSLVRPSSPSDHGLMKSPKPQHPSTWIGAAGWRFINPTFKPAEP